MNREAIIEIVRAKMDEINPLDQGTTILDPQIDAQLDAAAVDLIETLPAVLAYPVEAGPVDPENLVDDMSIDIPCPDDFIHLHKLKLSHWTIPIYHVTHPDDQKVLLQNYKHLKATIRKPFGVLTSKGDNYVITCYPPPESNITYAQVEEFMYVASPLAAEELNDNLIDMLAYNAAGIIYTVHGQPQLAELCRAKLAEMIQKKNKYL